VLVVTLVSCDHVLLCDFGYYGAIFMNVCSYSCFHGNAIKRFFGPCGIIFMAMCVY
jgi:hypothetical protein